MNHLCKCGNLRREGQHNCLECHAAVMRAFRKITPLTPEQRKKDNCRSYAGVYLRRGKLVKQPCLECGNLDSQMHHEDYNKPLEIMWLCRKCHLMRHVEQLRCSSVVEQQTHNLLVARSIRAIATKTESPALVTCSLISELAQG